MKKIVTKKYKILMGQRFYDPDAPDLESDLLEIDPLEPVDIDVNAGEEDELYDSAMNADDLGVVDEKELDLPTITQDELEDNTDYIEDKDQEAETIGSEEENMTEPEGYPEFNTVFQAIRWAKQNNETVRINYVTINGANIIRDVEPHGDFFARTTSRRSVVCWDSTVGDIRSYIIDKIIPNANFEKGYKFTGEQFSKKFNFSQSRKNFLKRLKRRKVENNIEL